MQRHPDQITNAQRHEHEFKQFWYVLAESRELSHNTVLGRQVLDEWLACFRARDGRPVVLRDRCLHRNGRLSKGYARNGRLTCPYHGWTYDEEGTVAKMPASGPANSSSKQLCARIFESCEADGYVYVRLVEGEKTSKPFTMPHHGETGWRSVRLKNRFANTVGNCVENFIDVPHTAFVHRGIFRSPEGNRIMACVSRKGGQVHVTYNNEKRNLGSFSWFLNPRGQEIRHTDSFYMPNVTCVRYSLGEKRRYVITSQSVPVTDRETVVYTDISYNFGPWSRGAAWLVRRQAQRVIDQDIQVLNEQREVIEKYGEDFHYGAPDLIHRYVESIREAIAQGVDPSTLPEESKDVEFWV
ncbi:MAG: Rieske 2Fe-2S domain-containing protein [Gammaproteobacteria bacterium]